jgi:hypothetical protein
MGRRRSITIARAPAELERAWHDFLRGVTWQECVVSTQIEPRALSRGTLLRLQLTDEAKLDTVELALRQFKSLQETGEIPSTEGQPAGSRGLMARVKESLVPPGFASARQEDAA